MKKIHPSTTAGFICLLASAVLIYFGLNIYANILAVLGIFLALKEVAKFTSGYQFYTVLGCSLLAGFAADRASGAFYFMSIAMLISGISAIGRMMFFKVFSYTGYAWFEPVLCGIALIVFGSAVLTGEYSWPYVIINLIPILFSCFLGFGILKDRRQLLDFTKGGYLIEIGKAAPEFALPDQDGKIVNLSDYKGERDLLLIFVRGDWCPGCHMMLRTYQKEKDKFQEKNIFVLAIGPDPVGVNKEMVEKLDVDFKVLSDERQTTAMRYGIQIKQYEHVMHDFKEGIPLPASFLVDKNGIVRYVSRPDKVGEFLNPSLIFPILKTL